MKQISYYNGEESSHPIGFGYPPGNIASCKAKIRRELKGNEVADGIYLDQGAAVMINNKRAEAYSGNLEIKLIAESEKTLKKVAKKYFLPFCRKAVVDYNPKN